MVFKEKLRDNRLASFLAKRGSAQHELRCQS